MAHTMAALGLAALLLLVPLCYAQNINELPPSPDVDVAAGAAAGQLQCSAAGWRGLPLAMQPTPNAEFKPETVEYYKTTVVKASWPAAIGLAAVLLVLLVFLFWRLFRCCCGSCCSVLCCCCCRRPKDTQRQKTYAARCLNIYKLLSFLLLLGTAAGCAFGMLHINPQLVSEGVDTLGGVKGFVTGVLDAANATLLRAQSLDDVIVEMQGVVDSDVNATDIVESLNGIRPLLNALPNPTDLKALITAAVDTINNVLSPALQELSTALSGLVGKLQDGTYSNALGEIAGAEAFLDTTIDELNALSSAAADLPDTPDGTHMAKMVAVQTALVPFVAPAVDDKLARMQAIHDALQTFATELGTDRYVERSYNSLSTINTTASELLSVTVPTITGALRGLHSGYVQASPFMSRLLDRVDSINDTVLVLPQDLQEKVTLLSDAKAMLDGIMQGDDTPVTLSDELDGAVGGMTLPPSLAAALEQLGEINALLSSLDAGALQSFADDVQAAHDRLNTMKSGLQILKTSVDTYISTGGFAPPYPLVRDLVRTAGTELGGAVADAQGLKDSGGPLFGLVRQAKDQVDAMSSGPQLAHLQDQANTVADLQNAVLAVPPTAGYTTLLDDMAPTYDSLPQPPSQLLDEAGASVESLVADITRELSDARSTIQDLLGDAQDQVVEAKAQSVGRINEYEDKYLPTVQTYDKWRQVGLFVLLGLGMLLATLLWLATAFNWPAPLKTTTLLLLVLLALYWLAVIIFTAVLKVGSDGCTNVEAQVVVRIQDSSLADKEKFLPLVRYYLYNEGGRLEQVLDAAFGFNITSIQEDISTQRDNLLQEISEKYILQPLVSSKVDRAIDISYAVQSDVWGLLNNVSFVAFNDVYTSVKDYGCCTALNVVGGLWVGLVIMGSCSLSMCLLALGAIRTMDKLPEKGCCRRYKRADFVDEPLFPEVVEPYPSPKKKPEAEGLAPFTTPAKHQFMVSTSTPIGGVAAGVFAGRSFTPPSPSSSSLIPAGRAPSHTSSPAVSPRSYAESRSELLSPAKPAGSSAGGQDGR